MVLLLLDEDKEDRAVTLLKYSNNLSAIHSLYEDSLVYILYASFPPHLYPLDMMPVANHVSVMNK